MRKIMQKLFGLHKPKALPMRGLCESDEFTWEDWKEQAKEEHPVRYFLSETIPHLWAVKVTMNVEHFIYWMKSQTYRKYHKLDLKQPETGTTDDYRWGWIDEDKQILYACFNVLCSYVDIVNSSDYSFGITDEDFKKMQKRIDEGDECDVDMYTNHMQHLKEVKALYNYWTIHRKEKLQEIDRLSKDWHDNLVADREKEDKTRWDSMKKAQEDFDKEEDEYLVRVMKIRRCLWT